MDAKSKNFLLKNEMPAEKVGEGVERQIMGYDNSIMMVRVSFNKGSIGYIHEHFHSQATYVESGEFEVTVGDKKQILKAGEGFYIEPHVPHGAVCLAEGVLIDVFSPMREDFLKK